MATKEKAEGGGRREELRAGVGRMKIRGIASYKNSSYLGNISKVLVSK